MSSSTFATKKMKLAVQTAEKTNASNTIPVNFPQTRLLTIYVNYFAGLKESMYKQNYCSKCVVLI